MLAFPVMRRGARPPAVAGSWYPGSGAALTAAVGRHLAAADAAAVAGAVAAPAALVAPHAGRMYSGPVAAVAYRLLRADPPDLVVLVGPSHFVAFDGVSLYPAGFDSPLGVAELDEDCARALLEATPLVRENPTPHLREHSLEMQIPFVRLVAPRARIVPLVVGHQTAEVARALGDALGTAAAGRRAVLVASTDLSHYHDAATAARLDAVVIEHVSRLDAEGLQEALDRRPEHACGGGPLVAVLRAARHLGATAADVLRYADSGDVSGDKSAVVGYLAAALGRPEAHGDVRA
jgi:AmmeMemoRadiSam system protein B